MTDNKKDNKRKYRLGDLIVALFEEASKISTLPFDRNVIVHAALKDLLNGKVTTKHPIALLR